MRTTLEIDDDVLAAAKSLAKAANTTDHHLCSQWLAQHIAGWASCPITLKPYKNIFNLLNIQSTTVHMQCSLTLKLAYL